VSSGVGTPPASAKALHVSDFSGRLRTDRDFKGLRQSTWPGSGWWRNDYVDAGAENPWRPVSGAPAGRCRAARQGPSGVAQGSVAEGVRPSPEWGAAIALADQTVALLRDAVARADALRFLRGRQHEFADIVSRAPLTR
jgi:hypothetical protein